MSKKAKHTSLDKKLKLNIEWLEGFNSIKKVVIGFSECCRHKYPPGHMRFKMKVDGGVKINGYSGKGVTDIFLRVEPISEIENIKKAILKRCPTK